MKLHFRGISAFTENDFVEVYFTIFRSGFDTDGVVWCERVILDENNEYVLHLPSGNNGYLMDSEVFKQIYDDVLELVKTTSSGWFKEKVAG